MRFRENLARNAVLLVVGLGLARLAVGEETPDGTGPLAPGLATITEAELREVVEYLAAPSLLGREGCGGEGDVAAAAYVAEAFRESGLRAAGDGGFLQAFDCPDGGHSFNVVGAAAGSDPRLAREVILVGAHYDHLGEDGFAHFPGADDNGSGVAALLEVVEALAQLEHAPRRSILFVAFGAEERGRLGSSHLAGLVRPDLMVNLDMVGHLESGGLRVYGGASGPALQQAVLAACASHLNLLPLLSEQAGGGSDQEPFVAAGIPALFLHTGVHIRYHTHHDTPDTLDYPGLLAVARITFELVLQLADAEKLSAPGPVLRSAPSVVPGVAQGVLLW